MTGNRRRLDERTAELLLSGKTDGLIRAEDRALLELLQVVARSAPPSAHGEEEAVAAFLAVGHTTTRHRWYHSKVAKAVLGVVIAGLALGGVAAARSGVVPSPFDRPQETPRPSATVPHNSASENPDGSSGGLPEVAREGGGDTSESEAMFARLCRSHFERPGGVSLDSSSTDPLVDAAGGSGEVRRFCITLLAGDEGESRDGKDKHRDKKDKNKKDKSKRDKNRQKGDPAGKYQKKKEKAQPKKSKDNGGAHDRGTSTTESGVEQEGDGQTSEGKPPKNKPPKNKSPRRPAKGSHAGPGNDTDHGIGGGSGRGGRGQGESRGKGYGPQGGYGAYGGDQDGHGA